MLPVVGGFVGGAEGGGVLPHVPNVFVSEEVNSPPDAFTAVPNFTR